MHWNVRSQNLSEYVQLWIHFMAGQYQNRYHMTLQQVYVLNCAQLIVTHHIIVGRERVAQGRLWQARIFLKLRHLLENHNLRISSLSELEGESLMRSVLGQRLQFLDLFYQVCLFIVELFVLRSVCMEF